jgi:hypothetical protein
MCESARENKLRALKFVLIRHGLPEGEAANLRQLLGWNLRAVVSNIMNTKGVGDVTIGQIVVTVVTHGPTHTDETQ